MMMFRSVSDLLPYYLKVRVCMYCLAGIQSIFFHSNQRGGSTLYVGIPIHAHRHNTKQKSQKVISLIEEMLRYPKSVKMFLSQLRERKKTVQKQPITLLASIFERT